jgi:hypothetical protein
MQAISHAEAKALGLKRYFTGKPCKHGHTDERFVSTRTCVTCANDKTLARIAADPEGYRQRWKGQRSRNPEAEKAKCSRWRNNNLDKARRNHLSRSRMVKYGLTDAQVSQMHDAQNDTCPGCLKPLDHAGTPHVDHCHSTGVVRGLLCSRCNLALGHVRDEPESLRRLADYLERSKLNLIGAAVGDCDHLVAAS